MNKVDCDSIFCCSNHDSWHCNECVENKLLKSHFVKGFLTQEEWLEQQEMEEDISNE